MKVGGLGPYTGLGSMDEAALSPLLAQGSTLDGRYRVEHELGRGVLAVVVAATHLQLKTRVTIKAFVGGSSPEATAVERLLHEARAAVILESEHVARVTDSGTLPGGFPYLVTEHLSGEPLNRYLDTRTTLPVEEAVELVLQAAEVIAEAHTHRIVHRNLKPSNLFLTRRKDGSPCIKVLDFGVATYLTSRGIQAGWLASASGLDGLLYLAPEQVRSLTGVDPRSDVWALGVLLYELLGGEPPFVGDSAATIAAAIVRDPLVPLARLRPGVPPALARVVARCLEKRADERIPSVVALVRELASLAPPRLLPLVERVAKMEPAHAAITIPAPSGAPTGGEGDTLAAYQAVSGTMGAPGLPSLIDDEGDEDPGARTRVQMPGDEMKDLLQATLPSSRRQKILSARRARAADPVGDPSPTADPHGGSPVATPSADTPATEPPGTSSATEPSTGPPGPPHAPATPTQELPESRPSASGRKAPLPEVELSPPQRRPTWLLVLALLMLGGLLWLKARG